MRTPLSWLRDFAPIDADVDRLTELLNELGLVVDGVSRVGEGLDGVVVARVEEIHAIEGADRIRAVVVDVAGTPTHVVCGAWNFSVGDLVPLAQVGTVLPGADFAIARRKMRGAESNGMLCSGAELGLSADHAGILVLPEGLETGRAFTEAIGLSPDVVFDLDITANRPDAMSVAGVARDLAAALRIPFAVPARPGPPGSEPAGAAPVGPPAGPGSTPGAGERDSTTGARVGTEDASLCPLFTARVVEGVTVGTSPAWLTTRLTLAGMRSINSVVDASNYVMLELGQPTHPYDLDLLPGPALVARAARPGETLKTLDGVERTLGTGAHPDCVITDGDDRVVGIGGVMGGESSEISARTTRVLVEAAYFAPMAVARTSKRLGLRSEASARFERGTDPDIAAACADRVAALAAGAGGTLGAGLSTGRTPAHSRIRLRTSRVNALLGTDLGDAVVHGHLQRIGFGIAELSPGEAEVEVPGWRPDVTAEVDLIEEVARHHGYAQVTRTVPTTTQVGRLSPYQRDRRLLRQVVAGAGLVEAWTPSLLGPDDHGLVGRPEEAPGLALTNPMTREESELRRTMMPGLLRAVRFNVGHRNENIRLFEVGQVFAPPAGGRGLPDEHEQLAAVLAGPGDDAPAAVRLWRTLADGLRLREPGIRAAAPPGLHPTRSGELTAGAAVVGVIGEVDPAVAAAFGLEGRLGWLQVDLEALAGAERRPAATAEVSVYPSSDVDLAFVVDEAVPASEVESTLRRAAGDLLIGLRLFDVFRDEALLGPARRSLAWSLRFCALDHTLTDAEVASLRQTCVDAVQSSHPAVLRG
ncbi:MAG: phenylalanine--tRNA ligase subunit beta [Acidimicrobiales bacterium]